MADIEENKDCIYATIGEEDKCLKDMEDRFQLQGKDGEITGFDFNGTNIIPCVELDALFSCSMIGERTKDAIVYTTLRFVANQVSRASNPLLNILNLLR